MLEDSNKMLIEEEKTGGSVAKVEQLRSFWGNALLGDGPVTSQKDIRHIEEVFQTKVAAFARQLLAQREAKAMMKQQMEGETIAGSSMITLLTDTDMSASSLEQADNFNELYLQQTQVSEREDVDLCFIFLLLCLVAFVLVVCSCPGSRTWSNSSCSNIPLES